MVRDMGILVPLPPTLDRGRNPRESGNPRLKLHAAFYGKGGRNPRKEVGCTTNFFSTKGNRPSSSQARPSLSLHLTTEILQFAKDLSAAYDGNSLSSYE